MASRFQKLRETSRPRLDAKALKAWEKRLGSVDYELGLARLRLEFAMDKLAETDWPQWADCAERASSTITKMERTRQDLLDQNPDVSEQLEEVASLLREAVSE